MLQGHKVPDRVAPVRVHRAVDHHRQLRGAGHRETTAKRGQDGARKTTREFKYFYESLDKNLRGATLKLPKG